jgi:putative transposase
MNYSLNALYRIIGISKQAVKQQDQRQAAFDEQLELLVAEAEDLREEHPGCGIEKMYYTLKPSFLGRDRFIEIFMNLGFRLKRKPNYHRTTYSTKIYYPNLITGMLLSGPSQVWQSDITYIKVGENFYYAVFIIDVYTREIVGYRVSDHMRATANVEALKMALKYHPAPLIHHSDKGSQYVDKKYRELLLSNGCMISMGLIAQDNAYAERINKTIKEEYLDYWKANSFQALKRQIDKAVKHYNTKRQHNSIGRKTPKQFREEVLALPMHNRPMATIYAEGQSKWESALSLLPFNAQQALQAPNCPMVIKNDNDLKTVNAI